MYVGSVKRGLSPMEEGAEDSLSSNRKSIHSVLNSVFEALECLYGQRANPDNPNKNLSQGQ